MFFAEYLQLIREYQEYLRSLGFEALTDKAPELNALLNSPTSLITHREFIEPYILYMLAQMEEWASKWQERDRLSRHLGFIQGLLWASAHFSIDDMKKHTMNHSLVEACPC